MGEGCPKARRIAQAHIINQNWVSTKSDAQDGHPIKRENGILPTTQMKGACLSMKLPHQSLLDLVPHGIRRDPQEILESLLY